MVDSIEALGAAGVPRDHDQLSGPGAANTPAKPVIHLRRYPILVEPEKGNVETVARKLKIVSVTSEEGDRHLWSHHEPYIIVALVAIEMVLAASIEHHDLAVKTGFFFRLLLDGGALRPAGLLGGPRIRSAAAGLLHPVGNILDLPENVDLGIRAFQLLVPAPREEAFLEIIILRRAQLLQDVLNNVMIRHHQPVRRHHGAGAAGGDPRGGTHDVTCPLPIGREAVFFFELIERKPAEKPHPLIGGADEGSQTGQQNGNSTGHRGKCLPY